MRIVLALLLFAVGGGAFALETARGLAASGATRLALARVEQLQPRDPAAPRWGEWEALRISLLATLGRNEEALQRADALPANMPSPLLRTCLLAAGRAGVASGHGAVARRHVARVLWQLEPSVEEARTGRLIVIDSYVGERQGDAAFRAMLRFQQDYAPLERATAEHFVEGLLALNLEQNAVNWLASLDDASPIKLMVRLKTGLVGVDAAVGQARAGLNKSGDPGYWRVLYEAARRRKDTTLSIEALEHLVNLEEDHAATPPTQAELWQAYLAGAQEAANQNQLLTGEDAAWSDFAARRIASNPQLARAFFAYLVRHGRERESRLNAQLQLAFSLQQARLERAALRLFEGAQLDDAALDAQARFLLGAMAERANLPVQASRYWKGLAAPPGVSAQEWQVRVAVVYWRGGMSDAALATLRGLLGTTGVLPAEAARQLTAIAQEMVAAGKLDYADEVLRGLLPKTDARQQREILLALARIAEQGTKFQLAADYYLRSALLADGKVPDAQAMQARLAAALNLAQAGYREDARAQFEWLLKNAKDPAQLDIARRELAKP
ncbi:MAG TPA: hypothetical protein VKF40_17100 [Burkholderiales bacterium]|nr:hypothetical protein [Burkholderiales bacterium]